MSAHVRHDRLPALLHGIRLQVGLARCADYTSARMMQAAILMQHRADAYVEAVDSGNPERIARRLRKLRQAFAICADAVKGPGYTAEQEIAVLHRNLVLAEERIQELRDHIRFVRRETGFHSEYVREAAS